MLGECAAYLKHDFVWQIMFNCLENSEYASTIFLGDKEAAL